MANGISNILNSQLRLSGLSSGLDTDTVIKQMMRIEQMKVDKVKQDKQLLEWKRNDYREITSLLRTFKDEYFDILKPSTNFKSSTAFASYSVASSNSTIAAATAGVGAISKSHSLTVKQLATATKIESTSKVTGTVSGSLDITDFTLQGKQISINLDGVTRTLNLEDYSNITDLDTKLQAAINTAFGAGKLDVVTTEGVNQVEIKSLLSGSTFSISEVPNNFISDLGFSSGQQNYITGSDVNTDDYSAYTNGTFNIDLNGTTQTIQIDSASSVAEMTAKIQADINAKFGAGKIKVEDDGSKLTFTNLTGQALTMSSGDTNNILSKLGISSGVKLSTISSVEINLSGNEKGKTFTVNIGGTDTTVEIDQDYSDLDALASYIQTKLTGINVSKDATSNKLIFSSGAEEKIALQKGPEDSLTKLGFAASDNTSNRLSLRSGLNSIEGYFSTSVDFDAASNVEFVINGVDINLNKTFEDASINDVISAVNSSTAGVELRYDSLNDKFSLVSKATGIAEDITFTDTHPENGLLKALGINGGTKTAGQDSIFDLDGVLNMQRSSNNFTVEGVAYTLKGADPGSTVNIEINQDVDSLVDKIKGFVGKYNELISKLNSEVTEKKDRDYLPLTDEQKESMQEKDIETWEGKAKAGMLYGDSIISSITESMRSALTSSIKGVTTSLYKIGITTGSYEMKGQLLINEDKLRAAIKNDVDSVANLFTQESQYSYEEAINDSAKRTTRYQESGLAQRLYDVIQDNIRVTRDSKGNKGKLLEKAGITGDVTEFNNIMNKSIQEKDTLIDKLLDKLVSKENSLYAKFTAMEKALNQLNSQSSWLTQQFSGNMQ